MQFNFNLFLPNTEQSYSECCREVSDLNKRVSMLGAHSQQCHYLVQAYQGVAEQLEDKVARHREVTLK